MIEGLRGGSDLPLMTSAGYEAVITVKVTYHPWQGLVDFQR